MLTPLLFTHKGTPPSVSMLTSVWLQNHLPPALDIITYKPLPSMDLTQVPKLSRTKTRPGSAGV
jgi:hypothetical protein